MLEPNRRIYLEDLGGKMVSDCTFLLVQHGARLRDTVLAGWIPSFAPIVRQAWILEE